MLATVSTQAVARARMRAIDNSNEKGSNVRLRKATIATGIVAVAILGPGANAAFAGEVTGSGGSTRGPANANSICVFSGLNDDPDAPLDGSGPNGPGGTAQSYGQDVKLGLQNPRAFNPGDACRGGSNFARQK